MHTLTAVGRGIIIRLLAAYRMSSSTDLLFGIPHAMTLFSSATSVGMLARESLLASARAGGFADAARTVDVAAGAGGAPRCFCFSSCGFCLASPLFCLAAAVSDELEVSCLFFIVSDCNHRSST